MRRPLARRRRRRREAGAVHRAHAGPFRGGQLGGGGGSAGLERRRQIGNLTVLDWISIGLQRFLKILYICG